MEITKKSLQEINAKIEDALKTIDIPGITIKLGSGTFSSKNATMKLEIATIGEDGTVVTKEMSSLILHAQLYGLSQEDIETRFLVPSSRSTKDEAKLVGFRPRANAPFVYELLSGLNKGKRYRAYPDVIKMYIDIAKKSKRDDTSNT